MNHVQLGALIGTIAVLFYLYYRSQIKQSKVYVDEIIKAFALGFSCSFIFKIMLIGYYSECSEIGDVGNGCLLVGGFALVVFALHGYLISLRKKDSN